MDKEKPKQTFEDFMNDELDKDEVDDEQRDEDEE